jgi:hypothetical protein
MSDWLTDRRPFHTNLGIPSEIKTQLGILDHRGEVILDNPLILAMEAPRVILKELVQIPISLVRDARVLADSGAEALSDSASLITDTPFAQGISAELGNKVIETEKPFLRLAERFNLNSKATESRRLAHLINPLKPSIDIVDVLKAVETEKLIPTLVINNSEPTESKTDGNKPWKHLKLANLSHKPKEKNEMLFLETPDGEHKLTLSYKPPVEDSELGKLNIQFKGSEHTHLLDNCTEADFKGFIDFLVNHPNAQKIENSNQLTK